MEKAYADHVSISDKVFTCAQTENNFSLMGGATSDIQDHRKSGITTSV
tara:strand:+ start:236 stop:379 length:144 start_codon:yes stop_codon:yes gene_type:complete